MMEPNSFTPRSQLRPLRKRLFCDARLSSERSVGPENDTIDLPNSFITPPQSPTRPCPATPVSCSRGKRARVDNSPNVMDESFSVSLDEDVDMDSKMVSPAKDPLRASVRRKLRDSDATSRLTDTRPFRALCSPRPALKNGIHVSKHSTQSASSSRSENPMAQGYFSAQSAPSVCPRTPNKAMASYSAITPRSPHGYGSLRGSPRRLAVPKVNENPFSPLPPRAAAAHKEKIALNANSYYMSLFEELEELGRGSFGTVFHCLHRLDGCSYAVKVANRKFKGKNNRKSKLREVNAMAALPSHPNLVRYYSSWEEDDLLYIQLEYCHGSIAEGKDDKNSRKVYSEAELKDIIYQIACGLACIHSCTMTHFDIKPENIYVWKGEGQNTYKIGDFGLISSSLENKERSPPMEAEEGDCRYLPTEMLNEPPSRSSKVDIFSLGMSIYEVSSLLLLFSAGVLKWVLLSQVCLQNYFNISNLFSILSLQHAKPYPRKVTSGGDYGSSMSTCPPTFHQISLLSSTEC